MPFGGRQRKKRWTFKQRRFVQEYCVDGNGTQAAIRAGYSENSACEMASALLAKPKIKRAIQERMDVINAGSMLTAERIRSELACMAFANIVEIISVEDLEDLPESAQRAIVGVKIRRKIIKSEDGESAVAREEIVEIKLAKESAIANAMRHLGMLVDRTKIEGSADGAPIRIIEVGESKREGS